MRFLVYALDNPGTGAARSAHRDAHRARLRAPHPVVTVVSAGPLFAEDGETPIGSVFVMDAPRLEDVRAYMVADPYMVHGVYAPLAIHPFTWTIGAGAG